MRVGWGLGWGAPEFWSRLICERLDPDRVDPEGQAQRRSESWGLRAGTGCEWPSVDAARATGTAARGRGTFAPLLAALGEDSEARSALKALPP
eukprot:scaffold2194_cov73-Isochrysis_galbana.AAC.2